MPLTPDDIRGTQFRVVLRGYAIEEVDAFLDRVESSLLAAQVPGPAPTDDDDAASPATGAAQDGATPVSAGPGALQAVDAGAARGLRLLQLAEQTAEQLVAESRAEAQELTASAEQAAREHRQIAADEAAAVLTSAREQAQSLLDEARSEAERERRAIAERQERETSELEHRVLQLQVEVARLQRLAAAHRERMVEQLTEQLRLVEGEPLRAVPAAAS